MALVVLESGRLYQAVSTTDLLRFVAVIVVSSWLAACGGSALEGAGPDGGTGDVDAVDGVEEVDATDVNDADGSSETSADGDEVETVGDTGDDGDDGEIDAGPVDWEPLSMGDEGVIDDVVIVSEALGFAASGSRVLRWDGRLWATYGAPFPADAGEAPAVHGVWADDAVVIAVGDGGRAALRAVDGGGWQLMAGAPEVALRAVSGRASDDVYAAGDDGTVIHWNGQAWATLFSLTTIDLNALWIRPGSSGDEGVFAVGSGGQLVSLVDGAWKASQITAGSVVLEDIQGLDDGTLVAVGDKHTITIKRPQAAAWQGQVSNDERLRDLRALASDDGVLRIFGAAGAVLIASGPSWNLDASVGAVAGLKDFAVADGALGGPIVALARGGGGIQLAGDSWSTVSTRPEATLTDFAEQAGVLWAVGGKGFLARRTGAGWSVVASGTSQDLFGITAVSDTRLIAVGARGTIVSIETAGDEVVITPVVAPVPIDLYGVASVGDGSALACGRGGTVLAIGQAATLVVSGTTADLRAVTLGGDGRMWVSGAFGTLVRMPTSELGLPEAIASGVGGALSGLAPSEDGVWAVGDNGVILRATAGEVTLEHEAPGAFLYAIATTEAGDAVAAGSGGLVLVRRGASWQPEIVSERGASFDAVHVADDGSEALIGGVFRLMHVEVRRLALESP